MKAISLENARLIAASRPVPALPEIKAESIQSPANIHATFHNISGTELLTVVDRLPLREALQ